MMPVQATAPRSPGAMGAEAGAPTKAGATRQRSPNFQLRSWRERKEMTRCELADAINGSPTGVARHLPCDEERVRRWETGEVSWPSADYRKALREVAGCDPRQLGFTPPHETFKGLRELRLERGWSLAGAVKAMYSCATDEEKKGLPGPESLRHSWIRWESGKHEPDGGRATPFYKPIIARMFGTVPERIFPDRPQSRATPDDLRDQMESRRDEVRQVISRFQAELDYLDAVLSVPVPVAGW